MAMPVSRLPTTADELDEVPEDGNRYEIIDGELFVTPAPSRTHQRTQVALVLRLAPYAQSLGLELLAAPTDVRASHRTQVQPDLLVLPRSFEWRTDTRWEQMSRLVLAVEILSPSTSRLDHVLKRKLYLTQGVAEYWIVDCDAQSISVWTAGQLTAHVQRDVLVWQPVVGHEALRIDLTAVFLAVQDAA